MSKRFGRNQRRKMREETESALRFASAVKQSYHDMFQENARLKARLQKSIEIDVDVLRDNSRMFYEAKMEAHKQGYEGLYLIQRLDERRIAMERDREGFIEHVAREMARNLARSIGSKWG